MRVPVICSSQAVTFKLLEDALVCLHRQMLLRRTTCAKALDRMCTTCCWVASCCRRAALLLRWRVYEPECRPEHSLLPHTLPPLVVVIFQLACHICQACTARRHTAGTADSRPVTLSNVLQMDTEQGGVTPAEPIVTAMAWTWWWAVAATVPVLVRCMHEAGAGAQAALLPCSIPAGGPALRGVRSAA